MTNIQIESSDFSAIQKYIEFGRKQLHLTINVINGIKPQRKFKSLSNSLDQQIKSAKFTNTNKANKVKEAMEGLNNILDTHTKHLSIEEVKEQYFTSKENG